MPTPFEKKMGDDVNRNYKMSVISQKKLKIVKRKKKRSRGFLNSYITDQAVVENSNKFNILTYWLCFP